MDIMQSRCVVFVFYPVLIPGRGRGLFEPGFGNQNPNLVAKRWT